MAGRRAAAASRRRVAVGVRGDLLDAAREADVDLSAALERALFEDVAAFRRQKWLQDNRQAIKAYNDDVEKHGTFVDDVSVTGS